MNEDSNNIITVTNNIVTAYLANNSIDYADLPDFIINVSNAVRGVEESASVSGNITINDTPAPAPTEKPKPAVSIKKSIGDDFIICLEDGKKLKMLKRHLRTTYNMTPDEYRAKWGLPADYPMVCPNYAQQRSELARQNGLGRKAGSKKADA